MDQRALQQQSQKLHLSPQLRQYLKFLYLPQMELKEALQQELSENPILEEMTESPQAETEPSETQEDKRDDSPPDETSDEFSPEIDFSRKNKQDMQSLHQFQEVSITKPISLTEHLERQLTFQNWTKEELALAKQIIGNLDHEGFLRVDLADIAQGTQTALPRVEHVLKLVQSLEPAGIAARSLEECLQIQLRQKYPQHPVYQTIAAQHLNDVARRDAKLLARKLDIPVTTAEDAIQAITQLDPRPARNFAETKHLQMVPDAQIHFKSGSQTEFEIEIFKEYLPRFRISPEYRRMMRDPQVDAKTKNYIKSKIGDGSQIMKALELRESTLRLISEEIVKTQAEFFAHGFSHLKPLRLKDLADRLEMHPSTISRAIHEKYVITPQGTLPFKSFFSQRVETSGDGEDESQKSIMLRIQNMIQAEDAAHPLSDQQIAEKLTEENITIARRTVAKYRELLKILPTHLRKKRN
ncbi:MAG TPA: RNA polymerase factor sigma-54 [Candidatus Omnitrophota bacterium]|nr:RNA polymerase factor sigma-54 [Candidatus Omnitrophota bacterium]